MPAIGYAEIFLAAPDKGDVGFVVVSPPYSVEGRSHVRLDVDGSWSVDLPGNDTITNPLGSRWLVVEVVDGIRYEHRVYLPEAGGPYDLELVAAEAPDDIPDYRSVLRTEGVVVVAHGDDADVDRPIAAIVWWVGTVQPAQMAQGDVWHNPSGVSDPLLSAMYDAATLLVADVDNTPFALPVPASSVPGRGATGGWVSLSGSSLQRLLGSPVSRVRTTDSPASTSSAVLLSDDVMVLPMAAGEQWSVRYVVLGNSGTTPDMRVSWSAPAGSVASIVVQHVDLGGSSTGGARFSTPALDGLVDIPGFGTPHPFTADVIITCGPTPGDLLIHYQQRVTTASPTLLSPGSRLVAHRVVP